MTEHAPEPDAILERLAAASPDAATLLALCSMLDPARPIPVSALVAGAEAMPGVLAAAMRDPAARERAFDALLDAGAGGVAGDDLVLNAEAARALHARMDADARRAWAGTAAGVMERALPPDPVAEENRAASDRLHPHAVAAAANAGDAGAGLASAAQVLHLAGRYLLEVRSQPAEAAELLRRAAELRGRAHGPDDVRVAWDLAYLNGALLPLAEWSEMAGNGVRAAEILEKAQGPADRIVVTHLNSAALLLLRADDLEGARTWFARALERADAVFGAGHPFTATILSNVGDLCVRAGDAAAAHDAYHQALEIDQRVYGPGHDAVARDLAKLGELLAGMGQPDAARPYLERAAAWLTESAGPADPRTQAVRSLLDRLGNRE
jgi:tetratricopeptide (TPR) repeat protein